jgi:hypothetical protein
MSIGALWRRIGERTNTGAANNASWLVAVAILAVAIPASDKIARNQVFFAAHGVPPYAWIVVLVASLVVCWLVFAGILALLRRLLPTRWFDIAASAFMLLIGWFFIGNVLARTLLSFSPGLAVVAGLVLAAVLTLVARRVAMGTILLAFAAVAAAVPLVGVILGGSQQVASTSVTFSDQANRPNVLWVVADELSYPAAFEQDGTVRPAFTNLAELASQSTTYTHAYGVANYTDFAVPSMLNGISDVAAQGVDRMQQVRSGIGVVPALASQYNVAMQSPIYSFDCDTTACAASGAGNEGLLSRYLGFAADTAAIAGRSSLAGPFADWFPSLDGKWRDYWSSGDEFGSSVEQVTDQAMIDRINAVSTSDRPFFGFWHTVRTHAPWVVDGSGKQIFPFRVPIVPGAHMVGAEADETYTTEDLKYLERRLWTQSVLDFDRQLGRVIDDLKATGRYDNTMIIVTADHGATMTDHSDRRFGDTLVQRWSEVAHVPLMVKMPGQTTPQIVTEPRATAQIMSTVVSTAGGTADPSLKLAPDLSKPLPDGPVFTTVIETAMTPWRFDPTLTEVDPWRPQDVAPLDPTYPFAVGIDTALLGKPVPAGWSEVTGAAVHVLDGESDQQAMVVQRPTSACPAGQSAGLVSVDGTVTGSVLWEAPRASDGDVTRGWAIVPRADEGSYRFWCSSGS